LIYFLTSPVITRRAFRLVITQLDFLLVIAQRDWAIQCKIDLLPYPYGTGPFLFWTPGSSPRVTAHAVVIAGRHFVIAGRHFVIVGLDPAIQNKIAPIPYLPIPFFIPHHL